MPLSITATARYLFWWDDSKRSLGRKIGDAIASYVARLGASPTVVYVNADDLALADKSLFPESVRVELTKTIVVPHHAMFVGAD